MSAIGLAYDPLMLEHGEPWHPENRHRLEAVLEHLRRTGRLDRLQRLQSWPADREQLEWLHEDDYVEMIRRVSESGGGMFTVDTGADARTFEAAALAAGACINAAGLAVAGDPPRSLCLVRPPGHHADAFSARGFCYLNNAALAAEAALRIGLRSVAIVDFDAHHGNGTQDLFYHRRDVLYVSLHESPLFPGTGSLDEVGVEEGAGFNVNLPLLRGAGDAQYRRAFSEVVLPVLDQYMPQLLVISAGYDAHHADPLAHLECTVGAFHEMTAALVAVADRHCEGRMVAVLEGGYDLMALPQSVAATLAAMNGEAPPRLDDPAPGIHETQLERVEEALDVVVETHLCRLGLDGER